MDDYCSTADILPTLLNLFGVDYDSRLLTGTDVLSNGVHVAVLSDESFITKDFRFDAGTETVIPTRENAEISEDTLNMYRLYVDNKFKISTDILNSDYYAHVFQRESKAHTLEDTVVFSDITSIFNQASVLYMYRNGYVDPESEDTFGGKAVATLGEFVDVLYRISQRPKASNAALPEGYEDEDFNGSVYPYYDAVCWAWENGLILDEGGASSLHNIPSILVYSLDIISAWARESQQNFHQRMENPHILWDVRERCYFQARQRRAFRRFFRRL